MTLRAVVLLLAVAFVAHRLLPRRRLPWTVPLVVVAVVLLVRGVSWLSGGQG